MNSRREFLKKISSAALAAGSVPSLISAAWSQTASADRIAIPGEYGMIVRSFRFVDLESPVEYFNSWLTPIPHFFVRNHMHEPSQLDAADWRLTIAGEVENPVSLTLAEISKLPPHSVVNTLECAGNSRGLYRPQVPGSAVGQRRGRNGSFFRTATARCPRTLRHEIDRQIRDVSRARRSAGKSSAVHSQHSHRESARCRLSDRNPHERRALAQASRIPGSRAHARMGRSGILQMADGNQSARVGVCRQLHEPGIPIPQPSAAARRIGEARRYASLDGIKREIGHCRSARWREAQSWSDQRAWARLGRAKPMW